MGVDSGTGGLDGAGTIDRDSVRARIEQDLLSSDAERLRRARRMLRHFLPHAARAKLRSLHRQMIFHRAMRRFERHPEDFTRPTNPLLDDLIYGWGNEGWSVQPEYLSACIAHALRTRGPILECGSGLSTVLLGAVARKRRQTVWSFEHSPEWADRVRGALTELRIGSVVLTHARLVSYGGYDWYEIPDDLPPLRFSLVVCDGPPGTTRGGRYGLAHAMRSRLGPGATILLDDGYRAEEQEIAERWARELGATVELLGERKPYLELKLPLDPDPVPIAPDTDPPGATARPAHGPGGSLRT